MTVIVITICSLVVLLAFEMRHREISERLSVLETNNNDFEEKIQKLKEELKKKKDSYEEYKPTSL